MPNYVRETLMAALVAYLDTKSKAVWGKQASATRDLTIDPQAIEPEKTPLLVLLEDGPRRLAQSPDVPIYNLEIRVVGIIRLSAAQINSGLLTQTSLNQMEAWLDSLFAGAIVLGTQQCAAYQAMGDTSTTYAGSTEGLIEYKATIQYADDGR